MNIFFFLPCTPRFYVVLGNIKKIYIYFFFPFYCAFFFFYFFLFIYCLFLLLCFIIIIFFLLCFFFGSCVTIHYRQKSFWNVEVK